MSDYAKSHIRGYTEGYVGGCVSAIAALTGVSSGDILKDFRGSESISFARQLCMYLCHVEGSMSLTAVGKIFNKDRCTVKWACKKIEDLREDDKWSKSFYKRLGYIQKGKLDHPQPKLINVTMRDSLGSTDFECRFDDGQKFAAVNVDEVLGEDLELKIYNLLIGHIIQTVGIRTYPERKSDAS